MKLSDTQLVVLNAACQRDDRMVLPLPKTLKGGAVAKVVGSLIAKGLVAEIPAHQVGASPMREDMLWREGETGERLTLVATDTAFAALGLAPDSENTAEAEPATQEPDAAAIDDGGLVDAAPGEQGLRAAKTDIEAQATAPKAPRRARANSKQASLIAMLKRPEGATIPEIAAAFNWQQHTVRGAIAGALKKKLGLNIASEKAEGSERIYRIRE